MILDYKINETTIECGLLVYNQQNKDMGLDTDERWMPFKFKIEDLVCARLSSDHSDDIDFAMSTVYLKNGYSFVINVPYDKIKPLIK